jgi:hypothetical protein
MRKPKEGKAYQQIPEGHLPKEHWSDKTRQVSRVVGICQRGHERQLRIAAQSRGVS